MSNKALDVFFKGLRNNNTNEYDISPELKGRFEMFCSEMVNGNPNADLSLLYEMATKVFCSLRNNPTMSIPTITL